MGPHTVLLLEDDRDLSAILKILFCKDNNCLLCGSVHELIRARDRALKCDVAFLDIELGRNQPNGIDAYHWLLGEGFAGRIYFLTAHGRNHPMVAEALHEAKAEVLAKPVAPRKLLNLVEGTHEAVV